jgi:hypothetical protein
MPTTDSHELTRPVAIGTTNLGNIREEHGRARVCAT